MDISAIILPVLMVVMMYFLMIRPNSRRKKEEDEMRSSLSIGDEVHTIGGIVGRIVNVKEGSDSFVIETSVDRSKILVKRWAIAGKEISESR